MKYTGNYNLKKPEGSDVVNIDDFNDNADVIDAELFKKVDKISGKGLSTEDYTTAEKAKLAGIADGATKVEDSTTNGNIKINGAETNVYTHPGSGTNPHGTTKSDIGLGAVDNAKQATKTEFDSHVANKTQHIPYATASGTNTYTVSISGISSLAEGLSIKVKFTNANTGASTLNINSLGAKAIKKSNGSELSSSNIKAGQICHLVYTGSNFQLLGEGGEYGTAQAGDVLSGKTIGTESGLITGTMPNNGAINNIITTQGGQIVVPQGYHNGSGIVKAQFANLISSNIKDGVNVGGVVGDYVGKAYIIDINETLSVSSTSSGETKEAEVVLASGVPAFSQFVFIGSINSASKPNNSGDTGYETKYHILRATNSSETEVDLATDQSSINPFCLGTGGKTYTCITDELSIRNLNLASFYSSGNTIKFAVRIWSSRDHGGTNDGTINGRLILY